MSITEIARNGRRMAVGLFVMTVLTSACAVAHAQFDANGSITTLGRTTAENLLAEPVSMRIIERAFVAQESREVAAARSDAEIMVENQHTVLGGMKLGDTQRRVQRVIEDKAVAVHRRSRDGYSKRVQEAQLQWKVTRRLVAGSLQLSVTFTNRASRLRSLDVEFPVVLKGNDYRAFFPGQNDFPEWPQDMALAYGLRDSEWSHYNTLSQPTCTLFSNARDVGLTLAATYDHPILPISFYAVKSQTGTAVLVTFLRVRLDPRSHRTITLHFKVHEGDWRGGLAFVRRTWPELFRVSPEAQSCTAPVFGGTGSLGNYYPGCFTESDRKSVV